MTTIIFGRAAAAVSSSSSSSKPLSSLVVPARGLRNLGNTCYLNSQLECAYHIPYLRGVILSQSQESSLAEAKALGHVFSQMMQESSVSFSISGGSTSTQVLCQVLGINPMQQQDCQEFWKLLLPKLQMTELTDLYQGAYEDYIVALDGSKREKRREEPFLDLSLEVSSGSVMDSLASLFGAPELLSQREGNGWRPEKGAEKVDALKGCRLWAHGLPPLLQLHLKRFQYNWQTDVMSKINDRFVFSKEMDLSEICVEAPEEKEDTIYDLQSVVVHVGEYGSGHYYAYVRPNIRTDTWYRFDDHVVTPVSYRQVQEDAFGGGGGRRSTTGSKNNEQGASFWGRMLNLGSGGSKHGWGGRTSSAYVLQYVRRSDISKMYCEIGRS